MSISEVDRVQTFCGHFSFLSKVVPLSIDSTTKKVVKVVILFFTGFLPLMLVALVFDGFYGIYKFVFFPLVVRRLATYTHEDRSKLGFFDVVRKIKYWIADRFLHYVIS